MFLLSVAPKNRINYPIKNVAGTKYLKLISILGTLKQKGGQFIDLLERQIISQDQAKELADNGVDNGMLNDYDKSNVPGGWVASGKNPMNAADFPGVKALVGPDPPNIPVGPGTP